ncbi:MAG: phosphate signaling complex protein PhoU [bacterium]|nr:phosphate signaling complex protein PhoU [bacterium]
MSAHLQRAIDEIMKRLISLSALVENAVKQALEALTENNPEQARKVIEDDGVIDQKEIEIEEECLKVFALHQPVAIDLRYLVAVLKMNNDLERIGDLASNIATNALSILSKPKTKKGFELADMYALVRSMLKGVLDAVVDLDNKGARDILKADDEVDRMHMELSAQVLEEIKINPDGAEVLIQYIHIVRHLERIGDHATNIAEDIIYMIDGEIIRHPATPGRVVASRPATPGGGSRFAPGHAG